MPRLFDDLLPAGGLSEIPGSLHHADDAIVQQLIERKGSIYLIKQLAQDLAWRDAQIVELKRNFEAKERVFRSLLTEAQVPSSKVEERLAAEIERSYTFKDPGFYFCCRSRQKN